MNSTDYHRSVELSLIRRYMAYTQADYRDDWEAAISIIKLMAIEGKKEHLERILDGYMKRIIAYRENTGLLPWEEQCTK